MEGAEQPAFGKVRIRTRGRLPHWEKEAGLYFVTFHLADSLPREVLKRIVDRHQILTEAKRMHARLLPAQEVIVADYSPRKMEEYFDRGVGECQLRDPRIAETVADALRFWHGKRYRLMAWCIMPNHVHVVFRLFPGQCLAAIVKGWKIFTARETNRMLGRVGRLWQREYYDRLIRDESELERALQYVLSNPDRAGLRDWQWV